MLTLIAFVLAALGVIGLRALMPPATRPAWVDVFGAIAVTGALTAAGAMTELCTWLWTAGVCS